MKTCYSCRTKVCNSCDKIIKDGEMAYHFKEDIPVNQYKTEVESIIHLEGYHCKDCHDWFEEIGSMS